MENQIDEILAIVENMPSLRRVPPKSPERAKADRTGEIMRLFRKACGFSPEKRQDYKFPYEICNDEPVVPKSRLINMASMLRCFSSREEIDRALEDSGLVVSELSGSGVEVVREAGA